MWHLNNRNIVINAATDCTLSLTTAWAYEQVANDLGLGGGYRRVFRFPQLLTTG